MPTAEQAIIAIKAAARRHHLDLAGIASTAALDAVLPPGHRPGEIHAGMKTLVVVGKKMLRGAVYAKNLVQKHFAGGRTLKHMEEYVGDLADDLEHRGHLAIVTSPLAVDYRTRGAGDLTPAGQGPLLLRTAAVQAGLGTWGLNTMVLTPQHGPRVFFSGVLIEAELPADRALDGELCLGLERCGRCAAICPESAIARRAPGGEPPSAVRGLDTAACERSSQPFGPRAFADYLGRVFATEDRTALWTELKSRMTGELWQEMTMMKEGAFTGCMECVQVCPVGEDFAGLQRSPDRRNDLPEVLERSRHGELVEVRHYGPQYPRLKTEFPWNLPAKATPRGESAGSPRGAPREK